MVNIRQVKGRICGEESETGLHVKIRTMTIEALNPNSAMAILDGLTGLLNDAVDHGASVGFLPPVSHSESLAFWQQTIRELGTGKRVLLAAIDHGQVVGSVQLALAAQTNAKHRASIEKLFVHTQYRGKGYGRLLMEAVEKEALSKGRKLLILDTKTGDSASVLCSKMGYTQVGEIPNFFAQIDGTLSGTTVYYKQL